MMLIVGKYPVSPSEWIQAIGFGVGGCVPNALHGK
jgi:hypothetical protein